ncbi:MAG: MBL fold metallo-hydrolase [Burkholderiales bacterium]
MRVIPLGSHDNELCAFDRAMLLEDPTGARFLYDPGNTVRGAGDPRLGRIDAVLLSHVHDDHIGTAHQPTSNAGNCPNPDFSIPATPHSNTVNIAAGKGAQLIVGAEAENFFRGKVAAAGGDPQKLVRPIRMGEQLMVGKVMVASVPASHGNGLSSAFVTGQLAQMLAANGLTAYARPAGGFVLRFSNGLTVYLSGDTGVTAEQALVVRGQYNATLAVMNMGRFPPALGPEELSYIVNELVRPEAVIISHVDEAATLNGTVVPGSKTAAFMKAAKMPVSVPRSGRTMEFDANAKCVSGC